MSVENIYRQESIVRERSDGVRLVADAWLPRTGAYHNLLVLLNGYGRPRSDYRMFRRRLHDSLPGLVTLAIDNRGVGDSSWGNPPQPVMLEDVAEDCLVVAEEWANSIGVGGFSLLGISMGGMIAQIAATRSELVDGLVLVSTTPRGDRIGASDPLLSLREDQEAEASEWLSRYLGPAFQRRAPLFVGTMARGVLKERQIPQFRAALECQRKAIARFCGDQYVAGIRCRSLVIAGEADRVVPMEDAVALASCLANADLITYPEVGHLILVEALERFVNDVAVFLRKVP